MQGLPKFDTTEAQYSITKPAQAKAIVDLLRPYVERRVGKPMDQCVLTDGTACVGGDALSFSRHFGHVHAVEANPTHAAMLTHNLTTVYGRTNVTVHEGDYTKLAHRLEQDVIFLDPPWGGRAYKGNRQTPLFLSNIPVAHLVAKRLRGRAKVVVLKVPTNYAFGTLFQVPGFAKARRHPLFGTAHVHHLGNMALVVLEMDGKAGKAGKAILSKS